MFERFTQQAREAVSTALSESRNLGADRLGCEHLLIALASGPEGAAAAALNAAGLGDDTLRAMVRQQTTRPLDADSLAVVGIDLDEVRRAAEAAFGPGALDRRTGTAGKDRRRTRMTTECVRVIHLAVRQAQRAQDRAISSGHLLIGLIDQGENTALLLVAKAGVDRHALRADTVRRMAAAA